MERQYRMNTGGAGNYAGQRIYHRLIRCWRPNSDGIYHIPVRKARPSGAGIGTLSASVVDMTASRGTPLS